MIETELKISENCKFICTKYKYIGTDVTLDYVEHAADHWHADDDTSIDISKEKAVEIISFLQKSFNM
jgi:hypothetical protein